MSAWEQLRLWSERAMTYALLRSLAGATILLIAFACHASDGKVSPADNEKDAKQTSSANSNSASQSNGQSDNSQKSSCLEQKDLTDVEALMNQLSRVSPAEEKEAAAFLREAEVASAKKQWGAAAKAFGASALCKPSTKALIGYTDAVVLVDRIRNTQKESLDAKLNDFQEAVNKYEVALELNKRGGIQLSEEQGKEVREKIDCLQAFIKSPNISAAACQILVDALKNSKIKS